MAFVTYSRQCSYYASYYYGFATRHAGRRHATRL
jgi:hypothetical protein